MTSAHIPFDPTPEPSHRSWTSRTGLAPLAREALAGLLSHPPQLPPKLFYDTRGARLFEEITRLDEYYLTRTEHAILTTNASAIARAVGRRGVVLEYGSGAAEKVRLLLDALCPRAYVPIDVSEEQLLDVSDALSLDRPSMVVYPVTADFTAPFALPSTIPPGRRIGLFLGSTIGNFHPHEARAFLRRTSEHLGRGGVLLLGVDLRKSPDILHAAYNDRAGVTAAFNLNALTRLRDEFGAQVDVAAFRHSAYFNDAESRIEMHLIATRPTEIVLGGQTVRLAEGEAIWTESSYKYTLDALRSLAADAGFALGAVWTDPSSWFAVAVLDGSA